MIQGAVHQEFLKLLRDDFLGVEVHRQIGISPIAGDPQPFEFFTLDIDPASRKFTTFLTEFHHIHGVLIQTLLAVLFLDLPFNRQTMAIPSGDIPRIFAHHLLGPHDHVFQDFVQRVPDMQMPVCVGRSIVQRKRLTLFNFRLVAQLAVNVHLGPARQPFGFAFRQSGPHREIGFRQVQRGLIFGGIGCIGAHVRRPSGQSFHKNFY